MKIKILFIALSITSCFCTYGQYDLTDFATNNANNFPIANNSGDLFYSNNFSNTVNAGLHTVDLNNATGPDTIFFPVTISSDITPAGLTQSYDTLTIEVAVGYWGNNNSAIRTLNANFTIKNKYNSYDYVNQSRNTKAASALYDEFKFVEGEVDTLLVIVTAGLLSLDHMYIRSTNATVVTNLGEENHFFEDGNVVISNPVQDDQLTIGLPTDISSATIALVSLEGRLIETKDITANDNSFDVSNLQGMYFLRELSTGSMKKIIIK